MLRQTVMGEGEESDSDLLQMYKIKQILHAKKKIKLKSLISKNLILNKKSLDFSTS